MLLIKKRSILSVAFVPKNKQKCDWILIASPVMEPPSYIDELAVAIAVTVRMLILTRSERFPA